MHLVGTPLEIVKGTLILFLGTYLLASAILIIIPETITDIIGIAVAVTFFVICSAKKRKFYSKEREESNVVA